MERVAPAVGRIEEQIGRRAATRHRVNLAARMVTPQENLRVQLEDISASGASIRLMHPRTFAGGHLRWLDFTAYAQVAWRADLRCGLEFADPLDEAELKRTREFAGLVGASAADKYGRLASAWVHGPGDW